MNAYYLQWAEESNRSPGTGVTDGNESLYTWVLRTQSGLSAKVAHVLNIELSWQPLKNDKKYLWGYEVTEIGWWVY